MKTNALQPKGGSRLLISYRDELNQTVILVSIRCKVALGFASLASAVYAAVLAWLTN